VVGEARENAGPGRRRGDGFAKRGPFADLTNTVTNAIGSKFGMPTTKTVAPAPEPVPMAPPVPPVMTAGIPPPPPPSSNMPPRVERRTSISGKDEPGEVPAWAATLDAVDQADANSTQAVAEYAADICTNLRELEADLPKLDGYMERQPDVNEKMRQILVDWLVEVHLKFKLGSETLFLTVRLLDRYLAVKTVKRSKLQLVGVTCMLLAAKFEEIYAPEVRDFVNITDKAYSKAEILDTEVCILNALQFRIQTVSPYFFLCRFLGVMKYGKTHTFLAQYILELTLVDYRMLKYSPTHLASSAALLANKIMRISPPWPGTLTKHTRNTEASLKTCAKEMCALLQGAEKSSLQALRKKFSSDKYGGVAKLLT
jgi:cyclin B